MVAPPFFYVKGQRKQQKDLGKASSNDDFRGQQRATFEWPWVNHDLQNKNKNWDK